MSAAAGVVLHRKPGDPVRVGDPLYELRAEEPERIAAARADAAAAVSISTDPPEVRPLVIDRIG